MTPEQEALVLDNMKLVHYLARKHKARLAISNSYDYEDLASEGNMALTLAAQRYDPDKGCKFSSFAYRYIDGAMKKFVTQGVPIIRFGPQIVRAAIGIFKEDLGERAPEEIAKLLGVSEKTAEMAKEYNFNKYNQSFEEPISGEGENLTLGDTLDLSHEVDFDKALIIEEFIKSLDVRDRDIFLRFLAGATQKEVAEDFDLAQTSISRIFSGLLEKAEKYSRKGEVYMSKISTLRKVIPKEKLKELLLENKTSTEIGAMFGYGRTEIETLKKNYGLSKASLGISYFDREDEVKMDNKIEPVETAIKMPEPIKVERPQPEAEAVKMDQPQLQQEQETVKLDGARLLELLGKEGRIVINAQSVVINIGA